MSTLKLSGRTLCSLIAVFLFVVSMACAVNAASDGTIAGLAECYGYTTLEPDQQEVYKLLHTAVHSDTPDTSVDIVRWKIPLDEVKTIVSVYVSDHPEAFWFRGKFLQGYAVGSNVTKNIIPIFELSGRMFTDRYYKATSDPSDDSTPLLSYSVLAEAKEEFRAAADAVIAGMAQANRNTDEEKALWLHDKVAELVSYVSTNNDQTAYGALIENRAVCAGYTRLYQYLLQRVGIKSWIVTGDSVMPGNGVTVPHAWNLVWFGDVCVYTDVTWNDKEERLYHLYYARDYEAFSGTGADHMPDAFSKERLPECSSTCAHQYLYTCENVLLGDITAQAIAARMVLGEDNKTFSAKFIDPSGTLSEWLGTAGNIGAVADLLGLGGFYCSRNNMGGHCGEEVQLTVVSTTEIPAQKVVKGSVRCSTASPSDLLTIEFIPDQGAAAQYSIQIPGCSSRYAIRNITSGTYTMRVTVPKYVPREYTVIIP